MDWDEIVSCIEKGSEDYRARRITELHDRIRNAAGPTDRRMLKAELFKLLYNGKSVSFKEFADKYTDVSRTGRIAFNEVPQQMLPAYAKADVELTSKMLRQSIQMPKPGEPITAVIGGQNYLVREMNIELRSCEPAEFTATMTHQGPTEGNQPKMNTRQELMLAREAMVRQMAEAENALKKYEKFPDDDFANGTIIRFSAEIDAPRPTQGVRMIEIQGGHYVPIEPAGGPLPENETMTCTFAVLKVDGDKWFLTGPRYGRSPLSWDGLVELLVELNVKSLHVFGGGDPDDLVELT